jgi:uncharacterized membrane protein
MFQRFSILFWTVLLIVAGVVHFAAPSFFWAYYPNYLPWPKEAVAVTGIIEWFLAIGLWWPTLRRISWLAIGILMVLYLPVHLYVITDHATIAHPELAIPLWVAWIRLPIQFVLIGWAFWMGKKVN